MIKMIITLSGETGVGKSYLKKEIKKRLGIDTQAIVTTRPKRLDEVDGEDKKFVTDKEFEELKRRKEIILPVKFLGYQYGWPKDKMESKEDSIVELQYSLIEKLKTQIENTFTIYILPKSLEKAKLKLKERQLPKQIEKERIKEMERHTQKFREEEEYRKQFDFIFYNDYTEESVEKLVKIIEKKLKGEKSL